MPELIVLKFDETYGAQHAMGALRSLTESHKTWIDDVAIVERHKSGRIATHTTHGSVVAGAWFGGMTGMLIGLLFPPAFFPLFVVGAGAGALAEKLVKETGLDHEMLDEIRASLVKGTSALIMIGAEGDVDDMAEAFAEYHPSETIRRPLPEHTVEQMQTKLEEAQADAQRGASDEAPR